MPKISVVMSVFNGEAWLQEAIDSILTQTFRDFEFIIIDDGSTDRSAEIIRSFADKRIILVRQKNSGLAAALNQGILLAKSELIARMDADDISFPERLQTQVSFLDQHHEIVGLGSGAIYIDEQGKDVAPVFMPEQHADILAWLPESPFIHPSVMFRKDAFYRAGQYLNEFVCAQDAVLFNRMAREGRLHNLRQPLLRYRITRNAVSRRTEEQRMLLREIIRRTVATNSVAAEDARALAAMRSAATTEQKNFAYHFFLAKLHLWNGNNRMARKHLADAARFSDDHKSLLPVRFLALLPAAFTSMVKYIFAKYKQFMAPGSSESTGRGKQ